MIPLDVLGVFVECASCGSTYDEAVLTLPTAAKMMDNLANAMRHAIVSIITADRVVDRNEKRVALEGYSPLQPLNPLSRVSTRRSSGS